MKTLSDSLVPVPPAQQRRLGRWLAEWKLDCLLRSSTPEESVAATGQSVEGMSLKNSSPPDVGQIRLFHPAPKREADHRPIYVAILEKRSGNAFLIAPFGRFAEPAIPGEWRTGFRAMPLRVLCLWNARIVAAAVLKSSWQASRIPKAKIAQALELHAGTPLGSARGSDIGPPLRHPLDPRHTYLAEESARLDEQVVALEAMSRETAETFLYKQTPSQLPLAAESREAYGRRSGQRKKKR
jgi:hypothetical protein